MFQTTEWQGHGDDRATLALHCCILPLFSCIICIYFCIHLPVYPSLSQTYLSIIYHPYLSINYLCRYKPAYSCILILFFSLSCRYTLGTYSRVSVVNDAKICSWLAYNTYVWSSDNNSGTNSMREVSK